MEMGENISPSPSLLIQVDVGMEEPHSLLALYVYSGEVDLSTIFGIEEENGKENQLIIYLKTTKS